MQCLPLTIGDLYYVSPIEKFFFRNEKKSFVLLTGQLEGFTFFEKKNVFTKNSFCFFAKLFLSMRKKKF